MSKELTVTQKLAAFATAGFDEATVRANVKLPELRSNVKLAAAIEALKLQLATAVEPVTAPTVTVESETPVLKATAGPGSERGFRFGHVWMEHLSNGDALVLRPTKLEKVQATATHLGISVDFSVVTQKELVTMIAEKLDSKTA